MGSPVRLRRFGCRNCTIALLHRYPAVMSIPVSARLDTREPEITQSSHLVKTDRDPDWMHEFLRSAVYSGFQAPVLGVVQIVDKVCSTNASSSLQVIDAPRHAEAFSGRWHAQQLGSMIGMSVPFLLLHMGVGRLGNGLLGKLDATASPERLIRRAVGESIVTGAVFDGLCRPIAEHHSEAFIEHRLKNAIAGGATFGVLARSTIGIQSLLMAERSLGARLLRSEIGSTMLAGVPAGIVNAELTNRFEHGRGATVAQLGESVYSFAVLGGVLCIGRKITGTTHSHESLSMQMRTQIEADRTLGAPTLCERALRQLNKYGLVGTGNAGVERSSLPVITERTNSAAGGSPTEFVSAGCSGVAESHAGSGRSSAREGTGVSSSGGDSRIAASVHEQTTGSDGAGRRGDQRSDSSAKPTDSSRTEGDVVRRAEPGLKLDQPTAFFDLDESMVRVSPEGFDESAVPGVEITRGEEVEIARVRPSTIAALEQLQAKGVQLVVLTSGKEAHQTRVLEATGLRRYFSDVWGYQKIGEHKLLWWEDGAAEKLAAVVPKKVVLVDDLRPGTRSAVDKLRTMGLECPPDQAPSQQLIDSHYIQCAAWRGGPDTKPLTDLVPEILRRLGIESGKQ